MGDDLWYFGSKDEAAGRAVSPLLDGLSGGDVVKRVVNFDGVELPGVVV